MGISGRHEESPWRKPRADVLYSVMLLSCSFGVWYIDATAWGYILYCHCGRLVKRANDLVVRFVRRREIINHEVLN